MVGALETVAAAATWSTDSGGVCFCPSTKPTGWGQRDAADTCEGEGSTVYYSAVWYFICSL